MRLGLSLGYSGRHLEIPMERILLAERLGYHAVWTAEAYGSDAVTPLAYIAAKTERIKLGTGIIQLAGRTAANAAMSMATVDALAGGGRVICGVGVSGPQIVEGWYGQPWGRPYYRVKDYVAIMRKVWGREEALTHEGKEISLPFTGEGSLGVGKALKSIMHMEQIPVWLGTGSEAMVRALYVGGMGHKDRNFHKDAMIRRGYGDAAERVQELYLAGHKDEAAAAIPDEFIDEESLIGPVARIKERYRAWEDCGINGLTVRTNQDEAVTLMAELARINV